MTESQTQLTTVSGEKNTNRMLCLALDVGEGMVKNGAEVHRVEDTINRICHAYGAIHTEIFAIPTLIITSVRMPDGSYSSQTRRIISSEYNMYKIECFNEISRKVCQTPPPLEKLDEMIKGIKKARAYPEWVSVIGASIATSSFTLFFDGGWADAVVAAFIGIVLALAQIIPSRIVNSFAKIALQCFAAGAIACLSILCGLANNVGAIIMGTLMYSIPGLTFGIAVRDLFFGDYLAGTLKIVHSILTALIIALGYILAMFVFIGGVR